MRKLLIIFCRCFYCEDDMKLDKLLFRSSSQSSQQQDAAEQSSPTRIQVTQAASRSAELEEDVKQGHHRWQSWDYSDCVYSHDSHPLCKSRSRKLSDLGAVQQPVKLSEAKPAAQANGAACIKEDAECSKQDDLGQGQPLSMPAAKQLAEQGKGSGIHAAS